MNKILILGAGKMGSWMAESLCLDYKVGIYDKDLKKLRYFFKTHRLTNYDEIAAFKPDLLINAVNLENTMEAFEEVIPYLHDQCILAIKNQEEGSCRHIRCLDQHLEM
ncbi:hypothetical protein ES705_50621 [subsurface metagenome]